MPTGSSSSSSGAQKESGGSSGANGQHTNGLRNRLAHVLPLHRRATFHVRLQIHQLSSLPFTYGQFAARWRFRDINTDAIPKRNRLGRKATTHAPDAHHAATATSPVTAESHAHVSEKGKERTSHDEDHDALQSRLTHDSTEATSADSHHSSNQHTDPAPAHDKFTDMMFTTESKGATHFEPLRDYTVQWEETIDTAVAMSIDRETGELIPNQLKVVIVQRDENVFDSTTVLKQPTGNVVFNLAEYADAGPVTRKYLLRNSRTNAVLKVTLHVEWMGGEKQYRPAQLQKSEILAGISGLLSSILQESEELHLRHSNGTYAGDGLIPYAEDVSFHPIRPLNERRTRAPPSPSSSQVNVLGPVIDVDHTERVIESIFNPFPSSSETQNPFTYYTPKQVGPRAKVPAQNGLLSIPGNDNPRGVQPLLAMGTQEQITLAEGKLDRKPGLKSPTTRSSTTPVATPGPSRSRPPSRSSTRPAPDSRKASLDLDSSSRSVAFSFKSESGEGSVESHSGHGHDQGDYVAPTRTSSDGSTGPKRQGWFKRMIASRSSNGTHSSGHTSVNTTVSSARTSQTDLTHSASRTPTPLNGILRVRGPEPVASVASSSRPNTPALTMTTSSSPPSRSLTPDPYPITPSASGTSTLRPHKARRSHEATVTFQ